MAGNRRGQESLGYRIALGGVKGILRILIAIVLVILLIYIGRQSYALGYSVFNEKPVDTGDGRAVTVTITEDMSVSQIGRLLKAEGLLDGDPITFVVQELISEYHGDIMPGTYTLRTSMTVDEMLAVLAQQASSGTAEG